MGVHVWSKEEKEYISEIAFGHNVKEIQKMMNEKFNYDYTKAQIKGALSRYKLKTGFDGRFAKGHTPMNKGTKGMSKANKTSFKKGHTPLNYRPIGSERINVDGYVEIKIADPNVWKLKHRVIWEQHYGPIPNHQPIIFLDRNKSNLDINNLAMVTNRQLLFLNGNKLIKSDAELTKTGINIAKIKEKIIEQFFKNKKSYLLLLEIKVDK